MSTEKTHILDTDGLERVQNQLDLDDQDLSVLFNVTDRAIRKWRKHYGYVYDQKAALLLLEWSRNPLALQRAWQDIGMPDGRKK